LRVPDRDLRAHGDGRVERVRLRRDDGRRRCLLRREARERSRACRRHRGDEPPGAPGGEDVRARFRSRGRRGSARGRRDRPRARARGGGRRRGRPLPAPELLRLPRAGRRAGRRRERERRAADRPRRPRLARRARAAGRVRVRAGDRRRPVGGQRDELRRAALRLPGVALRVRPSAPGKDRRRDRRRGGRARLRADAADARAAHPPREGDLEHHDEPDAARARGARAPEPARPAGAARAGRDVPRARRVREGPAGGRRSRARVPRASHVQGVRRAYRARRARSVAGRAGERHLRRLSARPRLPGPRRRAARRGHREANRRGDRPARGGARLVKLIYEKSQSGRRGLAVPRPDLPVPELPDEHRRSSPPRLAELAEPEVLRHFTELSTRNFGIDTGFYPLGSCTMKYNPRINERLVGLAGFADLHPLVEDDAAQGALELEWELQRFLIELTGLDAVSLQPAAGSQGELTGLMLFRAYFADRGEDETRRRVVIPDTAHGTNPASVTMAGYELTPVKTDPRWNIDLDDLRSKVDAGTAGLMLTNPSTLGLFDENIEEIARIFHDAGALMYYDGANLNAVCGISRPGDMGFDVVHINLHKTFSQPHGGGGPGGGPIVVRDVLEPFLPMPVVARDGDDFRLDYDRPKSIGRVRAFS